MSRKTLDGVEVLRYRNLTGQPLDRFPFHLYLNAFQPTSTFMSEVRRDDPSFAWKDKWTGSIQIQSLTVAGMGDVTAQMQFVHPDDDNALDRTVAEVRLPRPVLPGRRSSSVFSSTTCCRRSLPAPGINGISSWAASGFPRWECGGRLGGTVISTTKPRSSSGFWHL